MPGTNDLIPIIGMQVCPILYHSPSGVFLPVNGRYCPSGAILVVTMDERNEKTVAKGVGYQVGNDNRDDDRRT